MSATSDGTQSRDELGGLAARVLELGRSADEVQARRELGVLAAGHGAFAAVRGKPAPVKSIAAHMLWALERHQEAFEMAAASIAQGARDELCLGVVDGVRGVLLGFANEAMHAKRHDMARARLQRSLQTFGALRDVAEERATLALLACAEKSRTAPAGDAAEGRPTVINLGIWGEAFLETAAKTVFSCCLAPGNVPALARSGTVIFHIHTRSADVDRVRALPVIRELSRYARVEAIAIPDELFIASHIWGLTHWHRKILALVGYDSVMRARRLGADVVCLVADMLLADGSLAAAKSKLLEGREIILSSAIRAAAERILPGVDPYRRGTELCLPAPALYRLSLEAFHPAARRQFMLRTPQHMEADPHQFFFTHPDGFAARAFQWHPLAFSPASLPADHVFDGHTLDGRFASDLLAGRDRQKLCYIHQTPPDDLYFVSLDSEEGIAAFGRAEVSPKGVAQSMDYWVNREEDFDYFEWLLRQRAVYRIPADLAFDRPRDCRDEDEAIRETIALLNSKRPGTLSRIANYARAPRDAIA